jgi:hypothetical protein
MTKRSYPAIAGFAVAGLFVFTACSTAGDNPLSPTSAQFALGELTTATPELGKLKVCKSDASNVSGVFAFIREQFGTVQQPTGTALTDLTLDPGQCKVVAEDIGGDQVGSRVRITELAAALVTISDISGERIDQAVGGTATTVSPLTFANAGDVVVNIYHGATVTFTNRLVADVCTYTKGWYRNKNGSQTIIAGIDGRTVAQQIAIFDATPGKPGGVTYGDNNNNLNLYQQLLAAINNLDGNLLAGPPAVDAAIAAALLATGGSGLNITVAAGTDVSGLISVLSAFNEGTYNGWPHCGDEIIE